MAIFDATLFPFGVGLVAILVAIFIIRWILKKDSGTDRMKEVSGYIVVGTRAYLKRQIKTIFLAMPWLAALLSYFFGWQTSLTFICPEDLQVLVGFGFGASLAALFAQIGGGIFTKSADIGADLVGKLEEGIPEDDPRNPAVVADLVGDNVGDCAGRGSDLFQTFSDDVVTGMILGVLFVWKYGPNAIIFPFVLEAVGVVASMIGISIVRERKRLSHSTV